MARDLTALRWALHDECTRAFAPATDNCALFTARCVDAQLGGDHFEVLVAREFPVADERDMRQWCARQGLGALARKILGLPAPAGYKPVEGDVALIRDRRGIYSLGIARPPLLATRAQEGLLNFPLSYAEAFWNTEALAACLPR